MSKISIRFFDDQEVRAVWDDEHAKWRFSVLDIVGVLRGEEDYAKNRNYREYLKAKLKKEGSQLVSATNQLKLTAATCKEYLQVQAGTGAGCLCFCAGWYCTVKQS